MNSSPSPRSRAIILTTLFFGLVGTILATVPGISLLDPVDLSPGPDVYNPVEFAGNSTTHRLYVLSGIAGPDGFPQPSDATYRVKVIDTNLNSAVAGVDLGLYHFTNSALPFNPVRIAVDDSTATGGNKVYVLGSADYTYLRTIDGATNENETGQGTDLLLTDGGDQLVVNPNNHKVYVASYGGTVTIVDGVTRKVLTTISENVGLYNHTMVVNPQNNKVFIFGSTESLIIDGTDNSYTVLSATYLVRAVTVDPNSGRLLLVASPDNLSNPALFALDGATGALLETQSEIPANAQAIAADAASNMLYLGQPFDSQATTTGEIAVLDLDTLTPYAGGVIYQPGAARLVFMGTDSSVRLYALNYDFYGKSDLIDYRNTVAAITPWSDVIQKITVGYSPGKIAINPSTNRIYVADEKAPEITVVNGTTREVIAHIATAGAGSQEYFGISVPPRDLAVSVALNRIYISRSSTDPITKISTMYVDVYDGTSNLLANSIAVNLDPMSANYPRLAIDDTRGLLFATGYSSAGNPSYFVKVYHLDTFLTTIPLPVNASDIAVNPVTGLVYLSGFYTAMILDPVTGIATQVQTGPPGPVAINSKTNRIFVAQGDTDNKIAVINGETGEKETTILNTDSNPGDAVTDVAIDDVTNLLLVGDNSNQVEPAGRITVFDGANDYAYLGQIDVGRYPSHIAFATATRQLFVANDQDGTLSVLQNATPAPPDRLANISTRLGVETEDNVLIGGFIVTGTAGSNKQVLIRGIGPSLTAQNVSGALADPFLELHSGASVVATNDNWKIAQDGSSQQAAIEATTIPPTNDLESAILTTLAPGSYTAVLRGTINGTGVGLVEIYDLTASASTKMVNISTRGRVDTGDNVMIGGVIVTGANPATVLLRAIGPSMTDVPGALQDPVLELHDQEGALIVMNDDWQDDNASGIINTGIPPTDDRESAIITTLYPASYTAIVRGKNDTTGVALVEAYFLSD
jgi:DNA-binding beta-propeller fold protein YncE